MLFEEEEQLDTLSFWHPASGQSALERDYLEGFENNQRKGVRTMAVCPLLALLLSSGSRVEMYSLSCTRLVPLYSSQFVLGFHPADRKSLGPRVTFAPTCPALTVPFSH